MGEAKQRKNPDGSYKFFKGDAFIAKQLSMGKRFKAAVLWRMYGSPAVQRIMAKRLGAGR